MSQGRQGTAPLPVPEVSDPAVIVGLELAPALAKVTAATSTLTAAARNISQRTPLGTPVEITHSLRSLEAAPRYTEFVSYPGWTFWSLGARPTGFGNLDADGAALEVLSITSKSGLETLKVPKLSIREALGPLLLAVFNDPHVQDVAALKELGDALVGRIIRQVAEMGGEGGLVGQDLGQVVADRVIAWNEQG